MDEVKRSRDSKAEQRVQRLKANRHEVYLNNLRDKVTMHEILTLCFVKNQVVFNSEKLTKVNVVSQLKRDELLLGLLRRLWSFLSQRWSSVLLSASCRF